MSENFDEVFFKDKIDKAGDITEEIVEGCLSSLWNKIKKKFKKKKQS